MIGTKRRSPDYAGAAFGATPETRARSTLRIGSRPAVDDAVAAEREPSDRRASIVADRVDLGGVQSVRQRDVAPNDDRATSAAVMTVPARASHGVAVPLSGSPAGIPSTATP